MQKSGKYVENNTTGESVKAFVPDRFPPKVFEISPATQRLLEAAHHSLEKLDIAAKMVPSYELLLYGFIRKEAVVSSQIEGT